MLSPLAASLPPPWRRRSRAAADLKPDDGFLAVVLGCGSPASLLIPSVQGCDEFFMVFRAEKLKWDPGCKIVATVIRSSTVASLQRRNFCYI
jgi:hypothetical protein